MANKYVRVKDPASPDRCQANNAYGQCPFAKIPGTDYCPGHGANQGLRRQREASRKLYNLAQWQTQLDSQTGNPNIKSLREEIGIMRVMLQQRLDSAKTPGELMLVSGSISEMIAKIGKLVQSCHRIEKELGQLLDKSQASQLAQEMVAVIGKYVDDADLLQFIADDLVGIVERIATVESQGI